MMIDPNPGPPWSFLPHVTDGARVRLEHADAFWGVVDSSPSHQEAWFRRPRAVRSLADAARIAHPEAERAADKRFSWGVLDRDTGCVLGEVAIDSADW